MFFSPRLLWFSSGPRVWSLIAFLCFGLVVDVAGSTGQETRPVSPPGAAPAQQPLPPSGELIVFAAASLTEAFTEVGQRLEVLYPALQVVYHFAGSQTLCTQLELG